MNPTRFTLRQLLSLAILSVLFLGAKPAHASETDFSLGPEWREALSELRALPIQDTGFVRTGHTFSENVLSAITGRTTVGDASALETILHLVRDPHRAHHAPLIRISHPELIEIYGSTRISAHTWRDMSHRDALLRFLHAAEETRMRPLNSIEYRAQLIENLEGEFAIIPRNSEWLPPIALRDAADIAPADQRIIDQWNSLRRALVQNDAEAGTTASRELVKAVRAAAEVHNVELPRLGLDLFYHSHKPYRNAAAFYLFASFFFAAGFFLAKQWLNWAGMALLFIGFVEHSIGIGLRWALSGRAPVASMFESFIFAVGGMVLIALILDWLRYTRLAGLGAAILGFIFMVIAHKAPIFDSQIRPLVPALQSSWLTYHVISYMLGYSAMALSFFAAALYLLKDMALGGDKGTSLLARRLPSLRTLDVFNYRAIAIGFPLITIGIVAGGVWAATAWGRPWGFDPKETWSLITWLVYAIYLHVRYMAGWSGRSVAVIAIIGFLCVLFTYFGVNYLLPGLHSYV